MKNLFGQIKERLISLNTEAPQGHSLNRLNNLSGFISGMIRKEGERFQAKQISANAPQNCTFIPDVEFTEARFKYVNFVCWHDKKRHEEPIFLISNLEHPRDIIELYDQRYSIECLFKDLKSTSFNIHKTRLKKADEVSKLLIIAALAFILAIQYDQPQWRKKVQRVRKDQKVLSFFTFAYKLIDYFIEYEVHFEFSFQFSKNRGKICYPFT